MAVFNVAWRLYDTHLLYYKTFLHFRIGAPGIERCSSSPAALGSSECPKRARKKPKKPICIVVTEDDVLKAGRSQTLRENWQQMSEAYIQRAVEQNRAEVDARRPQYRATLSLGALKCVREKLQITDTEVVNMFTKRILRDGRSDKVDVWSTDMQMQEARFQTFCEAATDVAYLCRDRIFVDVVSLDMRFLIQHVPNVKLDVLKKRILTLCGVADQEGVLLSLARVDREWAPLFTRIVQDVQAGDTLRAIVHMCP